MAERRSLGDAMQITPAKMAFIRGETQTATRSDRDADASAEKTIEIERPKADIEAPKDARSKVTRRGSRGAARQEIPEASDLLDQVLVPVTIRLQHRTAQALRRAYLEKRLNHSKPDTQQEIVEEALGDWLSKQGFLE